jgi:hypothetical protein
MQIPEKMSPSIEHQHEYSYFETEVLVYLALLPLVERGAFA